MASIDIKAMMEEKERIEKILDLVAKDPKMQSTLEKFTSNGAAHNDQSSNNGQPKPSAKPIAAARKPRGYLADAVKSAMIPNKPMTTEELTNILEDKGFEFGAKDHNVAVNEALRTLESRGLVKLAGQAPDDKKRNLWTISTPVSNPELFPKGSPLLEKVVSFIREHGPATRQEILVSTGMAPGSTSHFLRESGRFRQRQDEKWELIEMKI